MPNIPTYLPLMVFLVQECPRNETDWLKASERLNCSIDTPDNTNLYHCVPSQDRSSLLEFCFIHKRIGVQEGNCIALTKSRRFNPINCSDFHNGCPTSFYFSNKVYKYPACLEVDIHQRCFLSQKNCLATLQNTTNNIQSSITVSTAVPGVRKDGLEIGTILPIVITACLLFVLGLAALIFYLYRRKASSSEDQSIENGKKNPETTSLLSHSHRDTSCNTSLLSDSQTATSLLRPDSSQKDTPSDEQKGLFLRAAEDGKTEDILSYIKNNLDTNVVNSNNQTALHLASQDGHSDVVDLLIETDAHVNIIDKEGKTPLYRAVESNKSNVVKRLLKCDNIKIDSCSESVVSPLCKAVQGRFKDIVEMLSLKGANVYLLKGGSSPILEAVSHLEDEQNQQEIVEMLIRNSANISNEAGETALHIAVKNNNIRSVELLINITDINLCDKQNRSPLLVASCYGNKTVVNMLLKRHAAVNNVSNKGDSALHVALRNDHFTIAKILLKCGADPRIVNREKETPLNIACTKGDKALDIVKILVNKHGVNINADDCFRNVSPLFSALRQEGNEIRKYLLSKGATLNAEEIGKALVRAARHGFVQNVEFLLPQAKDINNGKYSKYSDETPLHAAVKGSHEKIVYLLIERDVNVQVKDPNGRTPLHYAKTLRIVKELVKKGANVDAEDNTNRTPLFEASSIDITKYLCDSGASINATDNSLWTPLHEAFYRNNEAVIRYLIQKGANINAKDVKSRTPLHAAAERGNFEVVKTLFRHYNADVNVADENGRTPLHEAAMNGHLSIVKLLLEYEANKDAADKEKRTPLHHAVTRRHRYIVKYLVEWKADVSAKDIYDKTAAELTESQEIKDLLEERMEI